MNIQKIKEQLKSLIEKGDILMNQGDNKKRFVAYMYIILSLFALSFFGIFAIGPTISTITNLNKQYDQDAQVLEQLRKKNQDLQSLAGQYAQIESQIPLIDSAIPQSPTIPQLIRQLEMLATQNSLVVTRLDVGVIELFPVTNINSPIFSYTFSLNVEGTEANINEFIQQLILMPRIIDIERLTTGKGEKSPYSASITGRVFFYKPK